MTRRDSTLYLFPKALLLLIGVLLLSSPTFAQDPIPTSADPSSAEQETLDLEVTVTGDNFGKDSEVKFLVTGTTEEGGIRVKNVKSLGPQKLKVTVDVDADAVVDDFDIEVMSRGRTGKGTELFRVLEKEHPNEDTTPPGAVTVEYLGTEYNEVSLGWIAPADDGYDPASGPASYYSIKCLPGEIDIDVSNWTQASDCGGFNLWGDPGLPGTTETVRTFKSYPGFGPGATYSLAVRTVDDDESWNWSAVSNTVTFTTQDFRPDPDWVGQSIPIPVSGALGHAFDLAGNPVIAALYQDQIRILNGSWSEASRQWVWDFEDVPGSADSFALDPFGVPAFAWMKRLNSSRAEVLFTSFDGASWSTEFVATADGSLPGPATVEFDPDGNPAIAYHHWNNTSDGGVKLARRTEAGQWSVEVVDAIEGGRMLDLADLAFDDLGNPAVSYYVELGEGVSHLRFAILLAGSWQFEDFETMVEMDVGWALQLSYDAVRSDFVALHTPRWGYPNFCVRESGNWQCEQPFVGEAPDFGFFDGVSFIVPRWLANNAYGDTFIPYGFGGSVRLARGSEGAVWTHEFIDYYMLWPEFEQGGLNPIGPFVALDLTGEPSLLWVWRRDDWQPGDLVLHFAWKDPTPILCGDGTCNGTEDACNCPEDCGTPVSTELGLCADFSDNDCDSVVDCDDSDCNLDPACPYCGNTYCDATESSCSCPADCGSPPNTELACGDGLDDDCDTWVDCDDPDCEEDEACLAGGGLPGDPCASGADCLSGLCHPVKHTCK